MRNKIFKKQNNRSIFRPVLITFFSYFILAILIVACSLRQDYIFISEEAGVANYQNIARNHLYLWSSVPNYGEPAGAWNHLTIIPAGIFYYLLSTINISNSFIQKIFLTLIIFTTAVSLHAFLKIFIKKQLFIFISVLFYLFNLVFISSLFFTAKMYQFILLPLMFLYIYKLLKTQDLRYILYNFIIIVLFQGIFVNLAQTATSFLIYLVSILFFVYQEEIKLTYFLKKYFKKIIAFFIITIFASAYQIWYYVFILKNHFSEMINIGQLTLFKAIYSPLSSILQLRGAWWENKSFQEIPYFHLKDFFDSPIMIVASFFTLAFIIIGAIATYNKNNQKRNFSFWLFIFLLFASISGGFSNINNNIYPWMIEYIPFFAIFREPWAKFMPVTILSLTVLVSLSIQSISEMKQKTAKILILFFLISISVKGYPFFNGKLFDYSNKKWKKEFINPPTQWNEYQQWSLGNKDKYILPLPYHTIGEELTYQWYEKDLGNGIFPMYILFGSANIIGNERRYAPLSKYNPVMEEFIKQSNLNFVKLGPIDFLLDQKDINIELLEKRSQNFDSENNIKQYFQEESSQNFDNKLFLHKIKTEFYLPLFYIPEDILEADDIKDLPSIVSDPNYNLFSATFLKKQNNILPDNQINGANASIISEKINPSQYRILINNSPAKIIFVFSQSYHEQWKLYLKNKDGKNAFFDTWFMRPLSEQKVRHFMTNGYANSWELDTQKICENEKNKCQQNKDGSWNLEIILDFWPQRITYLWIFFTPITIIISIGTIIYLSKKKNKKTDELKNQQRNKI
jgi:hypothetical protein